MGFLARWLSPVTNGLSEEVKFWKDRALMLETKLEKESLRNRKREDALQDRVLVSKGLHAITKQVDNDLGFDIPKQTGLTPEQKFEMEGYVADCMARNPDETELQAQTRWKQLNNIPI